MRLGNAIFLGHINLTNGCLSVVMILDPCSHGHLQGWSMLEGVFTKGKEKYIDIRVVSMALLLLAKNK